MASRMLQASFPVYTPNITSAFGLVQHLEPGPHVESDACPAAAAYSSNVACRIVDGGLTPP